MERDDDEDREATQAREAEERGNRWLAANVVAILLRLKQEMDNRDKYQNPREELEERRERAESSSLPH